MSVITCNLHQCVRCMRCLKVCPMEAITIKNERATISSKKCIDCGLCIEACHHQGLQAKGSTLAELNNYEKTILLVPTSTYASCKDIKEARTLLRAIEKIGFDQVVNLSEYEGAVAGKVEEYLNTYPSNLLISSFCPVVNHLIEQKYPMLISNLMPFDYPGELAARDLRKKYDNEKTGIFLLCECPSKLALTRYPYGKEKSAIDHAIPMVDLFPMMNQLRSEEESFFELCKPGIELVSDTIDSRLKKECLAVDGFDKVCKALELAEFGLLKEVRYLSLSACNNGCIGGQFLWGNSFNGKINMRELIKTAHQPMYECSFDELYSEETADAIDAMPNIFEQLNRFKNVNEKLEALPGFDCGACGYPSCRTMAEAITDGICTLQQCRVLERQVKK